MFVYAVMDDQNQYHYHHINIYNYVELSMPGNLFLIHIAQTLVTLH